MKIVGYQRIEGTSKSTGRPYSGYRIYCTEQRNRVTGLAAVDQYVGDSFMPTNPLTVGDEIEFVYNRYGSVQGVNVVKAAEF